MPGAMLHAASTMLDNTPAHTALQRAGWSSPRVSLSVFIESTTIREVFGNATAGVFVRYGDPERCVGKADGASRSGTAKLQASGRQPALAGIRRFPRSRYASARASACQEFPSARPRADLRWNEPAPPVRRVPVHPASL